MKIVKMKEGRDFFVDRIPESLGSGYRILLKIDLLGVCVVDWTGNSLTEALVGPFETAEAAQSALSTFLRKVNKDNGLPKATASRDVQMQFALDAFSRSSN
ncbi:hypothetical protein [Methylosinus sp. KRF6]|uniref:hypothetical protein n=1 Tax=Methylosinus sp. KRF6 TaxID=2846853 RepID=UPI001C0E8E91|nr:hypothetical protein [Methylosinus sp. KRF6]MBU3888577.1 hypothetical protein [Methylosinus sp. KRF6]